MVERLPTFHPHAQTHVETEQQIDRLLADTDPTLISLCLDTGYHAYCGGYPVAFARKHYQRLDYVHLKTVDPRKLQQIVRKQGASLAEATTESVFCAPEQGSVDFETAIMLPAPFPLYMAMTRSSSTKVLPLWHASSMPG